MIYWLCILHYIQTVLVLFVNIIPISSGIGVWLNKIYSEKVFLLICGARARVVLRTTPINWRSPLEWCKFLNCVYNTYPWKWHKDIYIIYNHTGNPWESNHRDGLRAINGMLLCWRQHCLGYQIILLWIW